MTLKFLIQPVTSFAQNCSLVWCTESKEAVLIDPGGEAEQLSQLVTTNELKLKHIWLTHGHLDHVGAAGVVAQRWQCPIVGPHLGDQFWLDALVDQGQMFGIEQHEALTPDRWLDEGDTLTLAGHRFEVRHCPGHTPGHVVFVHHESQHVWVGDVIFQRAIGRTDFPLGDYDTLIDSIRQQIYTLPSEYTLVPGHGPLTTVGAERHSNPFVHD